MRTASPAAAQARDVRAAPGRALFRDGILHALFVFTVSRSPTSRTSTAAPVVRLRAKVAAKGTPIGPYDVLIAGQAKAREPTLVTHNTTEFQRVSGLKVEDWKGAASRRPAASTSQQSSPKPRSG